MMEDTGMEESLDAGSIPASSIQRQLPNGGCFCVDEGNRTARPRNEVTRERPGGSFEPKPGLKAAKEPAGLPPAPREDSNRMAADSG